MSEYQLMSLRLQVYAEQVGVARMDLAYWSYLLDHPSIGLAELPLAERRDAIALRAEWGVA